MSRSGAGFLSHVAPAPLYVALVFYGGSVGVAPPPVDLGLLAFDKLSHFLAFGLMQWLFFRALRYELPSLSRRGSAWLAALLAAAAGGILELYQAALPHRSAEFLDFVADALGAGALALLIAAPRREPSSGAAAQDGNVSRAASSRRTNE